MRYFTLIIGIYLAFLSCLPCGDSQECNMNTREVISAAENHQEHGHTAEACTPFCNCSCCNASVYCPPIFYFRLENIPSPIEWSQRAEDYYSFEFHSIWQPPKLV